MRRKALVEHNEARIQKRKKALEKKRIRAEKIGLVQLVCDKSEVVKLKGAALTLQIQAFKQAGAPSLQGSVSKLKADQKRQALVEAIESMNAQKWKDCRQSKDGNDTDVDDVDENDEEGEEFNENEGEEEEEGEGEENEDEDDTDEDSVWEDEDE